MTVAELIAQLQTWPATAEVGIVKQIKPPGGGSVFTVADVHGICGSSIDSSDSIVVIAFK